MKKLFGLALLALAFLAPDLAQAAQRFAVCTTTCTWDNTSTAMWSTSSGGATGASAPVAGDDVILDAATCVGGTTCTITTFAGTITANSITWGACTASTTGCIIAANTNNTNFTLSIGGGSTAFNGSGTGTRNWNAGTGTYALAQTGAGSCINMGTTTNGTFTFSSATWSCSGNSSGNARSWNGGGLSYGPTTFNADSSIGSLFVSGANTFSTLSINGPIQIVFSNGVTQTVTGALTLTGSSSSSVVALSSNDGNQNATATISLGAASSGTWTSLRAIVTSGASALTATNCFNLGRNTLANGGSCTGPASGGGGRIIGG